MWTVTAEGGTPVRVRGYAEATPCWATLASADPAGSAAFYGGLFNWEYADGVFRLGDRASAGLVAGTPGWLTHVSTEDIAETTAAVRLAGGTVLAEPAETAPGGLAARYADPGGAVFGCWQRLGFAGAQLVNEPGAMLWTEVAVPDEDVAEGFYGKVFGWTTRPAEAAPGVAYLEWVSAGREVAGMLRCPDPPAHWRVIFEVDSMPETIRCCTALGGRVLVGPVDAGVGGYAYLQAPQGSGFGVIELRPDLRERI